MRLSLRFRLLAAAVITTVIALVGTAIVFNLLFQLYFEERARDELETYLLLLTGNVSVSTSGDVEIAPISDPRFEQALSGYYWQTQIDDNEPVLSPSFWAAPLDLEPPEAPGVIEFENVTTGAGESVAVANWVVTTGEADTQHEVFIAVAIDRADLDLSVFGFLTNSALWLAILGLFLVTASWFQVKLGLAPLRKIRSEISVVSKSPDGRLSTDYPTEVLPLVEEVNQLLDANADALERARSRTGNLAHGLKTPLTIMRGIEQKLRSENHAILAEELGAEVTTVRHIVERELADARDSHQVFRRCAVGLIVARLHQALSPRAGFEHIHWEIDVPDTLYAPFDEFDLTEVLGNLFDNAMKWSESRIVVRAEESDTGSGFCVEDDGPGIPEAEVKQVLKRGGRLDPSEAGAGLGLSIVNEMANAHGCVFSLQRSPLGGVSACITWQEVR